MTSTRRQYGIPMLLRQGPLICTRCWQFEWNNMIDHIILTVSNVEHSLAFYEAALAPLDIKFFMPYKGEKGHPDLWGFGDGKRAFFWLKQGKPDPEAIH